MASRNSGRNAPKGSRKPSASKAGVRPVQGGGGKSKPSFGKQQPAQTGLLDDRMKRDILAVVLIVVAVALFVTATFPQEGLVTSALSTGLHYALGIGVYVLPFILLGIAVTFLVRFEREMVPARAAIGLALIFVAFLTLVSLFTPGAEADPNTLFSNVYLVNRAGYFGAGISWLLLHLFGLTVSVVLMVGLIVLAVVIIGFSLSSLIERLREKDEFAAEEEQTQSEAFAHLPRMPLARIRRGAPRTFAKPQEQPRGSEAVSDAETTMLGPSSKKASSQNKTQLMEATSHLADAPEKKQTRAERAAAATKLFSEDAPAKQMTRKLGNRPERAEEEPAPKPRKKATAVAIPKPQEGFELPEFSLLNTSRATSHSKESEETLRSTAALLQETLSDFGVQATVVDWVPGPTVTLFKVDLPSGVRVNRVSNLTDDIALALAAPGVRIFAPVPGTNYVGIEVPNKKRETVLLGDVLKDAPTGPLQIAIGKDVEGNCIVSDLATMPHLLIGGTTGSGKSVAINGMIMSILMRATPSEVRMIMIDPKRVEFTPYNGIPHLYVPVVTEAREAASALSWAVAEMERRLKVFSKIGARNIGQYNAKVQKGLEIEGNTAEEMPYLVIVIDELADLMMNVGKEVEFSISRLAQLARAAGIHLIVATQRPSTNVVTGLIKANITNRIAFNVASGIDSRVVLDTPGAENLIGLGDLLLSKPELAKPQRIQGCFVSEDEISAVVEKLKSQGEPEYHNDILKTNLISLGDSAPDGSGGSGGGPDDPLVWDAAEIVVSTGVGSTSNLQRRLSVGYSRAGRIMDLLEEKGIVGPPNGSKPREVMVDALELETLKAFEQQDS